MSWIVKSEDFLHTSKKSFRWKRFQLWLYIKTSWIWMDYNASWNQFMLCILQSKRQAFKKLQRQYGNLKLNQALAEVTKLLHLIWSVHTTSASCVRSSFSLKRVNNSTRFSQSEERISHLVFISTNGDFLKKMKFDLCVDRFYNKMIDEFTKKKRKIELICK